MNTLMLILDIPGQSWEEKLDYLSKNYGSATFNMTDYVKFCFDAQNYTVFEIDVRVHGTYGNVGPLSILLDKNINDGEVFLTSKIWN